MSDHFAEVRLVDYSSCCGNDPLVVAYQDALLVGADVTLGSRFGRPIQWKPMSISSCRIRHEGPGSKAMTFRIAH